MNKEKMVTQIIPRQYLASQHGNKIQKTGDVKYLQNKYSTTKTSYINIVANTPDKYIYV